MDQVNVPLTCRPCDMRLVAFICSESYQVLPVGELADGDGAELREGPQSIESVLLVEYPG